MRKTAILMSMLIMALIFLGAKKPENIRYDIECAGNGTQGNYLVKVWVYSKSDKVSIETFKQCAVHGVIFKGYAGKSNCTQQKPLANSPSLEEQQADFFNAFFNEDKSFAKYASEIGGTIERIKIGKEYKSGIVISVSKDMLRQDLEKAGIIRGLGTGF